MKVAFIGTHGTGKTALCLGLAAELQKNSYGAELVTEFAADAQKRGLPINEETTIGAQAYILHMQMARELAATHHKTGDQRRIVVCDRSVIDNYVYMLARFGSVPAYETIVYHWLNFQPYDHLFKVPIVGGATLEDNGVRSLSKDFQLEIDRRLTEFLKGLDIGTPCSILPPDNRGAWLNLVKEKIGLEFRI